MKGIDRAFCIEGLNLERYLRQAAESNLTVTAVKRNGRRMTAIAEESDFLALQTLAEQGGWRFTRGCRRGAGRLVDCVIARKTLLVMATVIVVILFLSTQVIWHIELRDAGIYAADLEAYLMQHDIHPMKMKRSVDLNTLRDALEWRYPDIAWADCGWRGGTLCIRLVQGTAMGDAVSQNGAGDIIASRDGIVESVITLAGTDLVKPGDVIRKGQMLIQGMERVADEGVIPVMARGQVFARVWENVAVRVPLWETQTNYTGRETVVTTVICPWFSLWSLPEQIYDTEDIEYRKTPLGGIFLPLSFAEQTHMETELMSKRRNEEVVRAEAGEAALRALLEKAGKRDDLVDKWVDCCMIEDEVIEAVATGEWIVDVAQPLRYQP